jgi:hypothetical protein
VAAALRNLSRFAAVAAGIAMGAASLVGDSRAPLPSRLLWAWERPTDLSSAPAGVGIAYLAGTIRLSSGRMASTPRLQPLAARPDAAMVAVVRIETDGRAAAAADLEERTAREVLALCGRAPRVSGVQVDFDATAAERSFYSGMLAKLRRVVPERWTLSITALASWCLGDPWIRALPIDDAVPMLFRMGADARTIRAQLESGRDFSLPVCRASLGVSLDEPLALPAGRRIYLFSPTGWNPATIAEAARRFGGLR